MTTKQETNLEIPEYTKTQGNKENTLKAQKVKVKSANSMHSQITIIVGSDT